MSPYLRIVVAVAFLGIGNVALFGQTIDLAGDARFAIGDESEWAESGFDDQTWSIVTVPGNLFAEDIGYTGWTIGWYRIHFDIPSEFDLRDPALYLGVVGNSDTVYLNGIEVGNEGMAGSLPVAAPRIERVYAVPSELLRPGERNVLAIRVWTGFGQGGLASGPLLLGQHQVLRNRAYVEEQPARMIEIVTLTIITVFALGSLLLACGLKRRSSLPSLAILLLIFLAMRVVGSFPWYEAGWLSPRAFIWLLVGYLVAPLASVYFTSALFTCPLTRIPWLVAVVLTALLAVTIHLPMTWRVPPIPWLSTAVTVSWIVSICLHMALLLRVMIHAIASKHHEWIPVSLGFATLVMAYLFSVTGASSHFPVWVDSYILEDIALLGFLLGMTVAAVLQHVRVTTQVATLSDRVMLAHEEERARLSRELHDGVAQSLQAIRLKTKMIHSRSGSDSSIHTEMEQLSQDVGRTLEELRTVSRDLRPAVLDDLSLGEAITWYAHQMEDQAENVAIKVHSDIGHELPLRIVEHVYRICQEAIINALRHGHARSIEVILTSTVHHLSVTISDDGEGFETNSSGGLDGIGLVNMQDRTQLLDGTCSIRSGIDEGTTIGLRIPLEHRH